MADISGAGRQSGFSGIGNILPGLGSAPKSNLFVAAGVIVVVAMIIIPLPAFLLDVFMAFNLTLSLFIILITLYTSRALDFSVFPTMLLVTMVFGIGLNVSSTRLILSQGEDFNGKIVRAFATFVVGSSGNDGLAIGFIIFIIIIAIQFVITKGATRVAEVAARFTLDALPGKQMAIDAEFSSGVINEEEARRRKRDLQREVDFYGAMDGSSKFVSGNVKVGILITVINIVGGLIVGVGFHGESWQAAIGNYISFSIGDGLVSQFPTLLISTATGLIVTRAVSDGSFGSDVTKQFSRQHMIFWIAAFALFGMGLLPGFPGLVLFPMAAVTLTLAVTMSRRAARAAETPAVKTAKEKTAGEAAEISPVVPLDPLSLELGYGLVPLVDKEHGAELLGRVTQIRKETALDIGLVVPKIRIIDNMRLDTYEYCFKIKGVEVGRGSLRMGMFLAINPGTVSEEVAGEKTTEPTFGAPALWITEDTREKADRAGYIVVDPPSIIATHLTEIIKKHAAEILGRQELQAILDTLRKDYPAVVDEAVKIPLGMGGIQKVLQNLLRERVSIRNMVEILETIADYGAIVKDVSFITEKTRQALARQICFQYADESKTLNVFTIMPRLEQAIIDSRVETAGGLMAALKPETQRRWFTALRGAQRLVQDSGRFAFIILCSEAARPLVRSSTARDFPALVALSSLEIVPDVKIESMGEIKLEG